MPDARRDASLEVIAALSSSREARYRGRMFTIKHDFDATVITLVDEGAPPLQEDVTVTAFAECVTVEQYDAQADQVMKITLSPTQLRELRAALNLPEGIYRMRAKDEGPDQPSN